MIDGKTGEKIEGAGAARSSGTLLVRLCFEGSRSCPYISLAVAPIYKARATSAHQPDERPDERAWALVNELATGPLKASGQPSFGDSSGSRG